MSGVTYQVSHVRCHMSIVMCHVSCDMCHMLYIFYFTKWLSWLVEALLSTWPTPSTFKFFLIKNALIPNIYLSRLVVVGLGSLKKQIDEKVILGLGIFLWVLCSFFHG